MRQIGFETDIVYPHQRDHSQKTFADNFNFIKESISDIEDEEEVINYAEVSLKNIK